MKGLQKVSRGNSFTSHQSLGLQTIKFHLPLVHPVVDPVALMRHLVSVVVVPVEQHVRYEQVALRVEMED